MKIFKVVYAPPPIGQWQFHSENSVVGYAAWNIQTAISYAKAEAKKHRPSRIHIYDKDGNLESTNHFSLRGGEMEVRKNPKRRKTIIEREEKKNE
jgi:hypothetical protein